VIAPASTAAGADGLVRLGSGDRARRVTDRCRGAGFRRASREDTSGWLYEQENVTLVTRFGGLSVLASWMTLLVRRQRHAEPSWVDRLGRAMRVAWIVSGFAVMTGSNGMCGNGYTGEAK
jgi:hypothetical protein